jgi:hypothetical protein
LKNVLKGKWGVQSKDVAIIRRIYGKWYN